MAFDVEAARKEGYSDKEIADYLGGQRKFDVTGAIKEGYSPSEIIDHLNPKEAGDESNLVRGFTDYGPQMKSTLGAAEAMIGQGIKKTFGEGPVSKYLVEHGLQNYKEAEEAQKKTARATDSFTDAYKKGVGSVVTEWLPYQVGSGAANLLESAAVATAGAVVGSAMAPGAGTAVGATMGLVEKTLVKKGIKEAAEKLFEETAKKEGKEAAAKAVTKFTAEQGAKTLTKEEGQAFAKAGAKKYGQNAALAGQAITHGVGEVGGRALENAETVEDIDMSKVGIASAVHATADYIANKIGLDALTKASPSTKNFLLDVAKGMFITGSKETPPELLQTAAERYGAGLPLGDKKAIEDYINTTAGAYGMSMVPGGVGGARSRFAATTEPQQQTPPPPPPPAGQTVPIAPALAAKEQKVAAVTPERQARIDEVASNLKGWDPEDAQREAERRVAEEEQAAIQAQEIKAKEAEKKLIKPAENKEEELTQEFIGRGESPQRAKELALAKIKEDEEADALAEAEEQNATRPNTTPSGVSTGVSSEPPAGVPTGGIGAVKPNGVVSPTENAGLPTSGEGQKPPTVAAQLSIPEQVKALEDKRNQLTTAQGRRPSKGTKNRAQWDAITAERDALIAQSQQQGVPSSGTETPQAQQTETQGQATTPAEQPVKETPVIVEPTLDEDIATQKKLLGALDEARKKLLKDENLASGDPRIDAAKNAVEKAQNEYDAYVTESEPRRTKRIEELTEVKETPATARGLADVGQAGTAIVDNMYSGMLEAHKKGTTKFAGNEDPILQTAKEQGKTFETTAELQDFANQPEVQTRANEISQYNRIQNLLKTGKTLEEIQTQFPNLNVNGILEKEQASTIETAAPAPVKQKRGPKGGQRETTVPKTKEEKNAYNQISVAADRAHKKLGTQLENPTSKTERETAIYELLKHKKATQGRAVAKRIGETLAKHATAEDITRAEARIANETKGAKKTEVGHTTSIGKRQSRSEPNIRFNYAENATQALQIVIKTGNLFQKLLAKKLIGFVGGVKFTSIVEGEPLPEALQEHIDMWNTARATYVYDLSTGEKHIFVRANGPDQGINNIDVLHEALHAATLQKLRIGLKSLKEGYELNSPLAKFARDIQDLMARAKKQYLEEKAAGYLSKGVIDRIESVKEANGDLTIFTDPDEFLAYGMSDEDVQSFLNLVKGVHTNESIFTKFVRSILNVFGLGDGYYTGLSDLMHITGGILEAQPNSREYKVAHLEKEVATNATAKATAMGTKEGEEETPAQAERTQKQVDKAVDVAFAKVDQSRTAEEMAKGVSAVQAARDPKAAIPALKRLWAKLDYEKRRLLLKASTTEFMVDWAKKDIPELSNTYLLMQKMSGMMQGLLSSGGELSKIIHNAYLEDPTLQRKLENITLASTIAGVDPSNPNAKESSAKLNTAYVELGPKGQEVFKLTKNHFEDLADYYTQLLNDQVTKSGLGIAEQQNIMAKLREIYEKGKKISPYFPLVRRGQYWLSVGTGETRQFYLYESMQERDAAAQAMADEKVKQKPGESDEAFAKRKQENFDELFGEKTFNRGNDIKDLRNKTYASSELLKSIFSSIESSDLTDPDAKEALMDSIYQVYLQTMPEQSFRKQFINRKNITGFSTDFLQNVSTTTAKMAVQLARIKYASKMQNSLRDAKTSIEGRSELEPYISEMRDRVANQLNPPPPTAASTIAGSLNKASFIWYLSGASSALLQPLSVFQTGVPVLARYGAANAVRELTRTMKFWSLYGYKKTNADGSVNWVAPSLEHSKHLTPLERKAVAEMMARDVSKSTYASAIFEYKSNPTEKLHGPKMELAKNTVDALVLGGLMHSSERLSREMMYLASFRLNQQKNGGNFKASVDQAVTDTNEALGNYGTYNRPLIMQGPIGKLALQFTMYPLHVTTFLVKNFKEMIKPMNGRTKAEAAKKFFGTLGTTFVLAGAAGLPGFSAVMGMLGVAWRDVFKDKDMPEDLRSMDFELWFRQVFLPEVFPTFHDVIERGLINKLTGENVADRAGVNNMFSRDTKETKTVREGAMAMALEKAGPAANMILSIAESFEAFMNGDYQKGVEKGVPAGFRNYVVAHKYATEGAKDYKGAPLLRADSFTKGELIGQAIGFRPDVLSNAQYVNFEVTKIEQRINNQKTQLLNNLNRSFRQIKPGDASSVADYAKYFKDIEKFNKKYPSFEITSDELNDSLEKRAEQRVSSYKGININDQNALFAVKAAKASREALYEREKQRP